MSLWNRIQRLSEKSNQAAAAHVESDMKDPALLSDNELEAELRAIARRTNDPALKKEIEAELRKMAESQKKWAAIEAEAAPARREYEKKNQPA